MPAVLFNHWHGAGFTWARTRCSAPSRAASRPLPTHSAAEGYCALCLDMWCFGERSKAHTESDLFKEMLWKGQGALGHDGLRYAAGSRLPHDPSGGRLLADRDARACRWEAPWPGGRRRSIQRIKVCVDICCLTDFERLDCSQGPGPVTGSTTSCPSLLKHFTTSKSMR